MHYLFEYQKWLLLIKTMVALFLVLCLAYCSPHTKQVVYSKTIEGIDTLIYDSIIIGKTISFEFENTSKTSPITFWFYNQHGVNYNSSATMLASILRDNMSDEQKAIAIWRLVTVSGFSHSFEYNHMLNDHVDPIALVRFPYFLCGEKAGILANLAALAGLESRVVGLDGHVVAEVKYNKTWHMFDADQGCYLSNTLKEIVSIEELQRHPEWLKSENATFISTDNFWGFDKYKKQIAEYQSSWIDTSFLIRNYTFPSTSISLFPDDKVSFRLSPTSCWSSMLNPRYLYDTHGVLTRKLNQNQQNVQTNDSTITFTENFPYYLKLLRISSDSPMSTEVYIQYQNRITQKHQKTFLGILNGSDELTQNFDAPSKSDIYYNYQIVFKHLSTSQINHIRIEHEFEFNSVTFPLHYNDNKIITTDTFEQKSLTFQIVK